VTAAPGKAAAARNRKAPAARDGQAPVARDGQAPVSGQAPGAAGEPLSALARIVGRAAGRPEPPPDTERCDLCAVPVPGTHAHVLDTEAGEIMCACRACALLFERPAAGRGHYRLVPGRRIRLDGVSPASLGVPVGLAFFVRQPGGTVMAHYPSPLGVTQWETGPAAWEAATAACGPLASLQPMVEALLVNTVRSAQECWLVPIDECYRLAAVVRREWRGLGGGDQVWAEIGRFFSELATRSSGRRAAAG
jgi:Family of unknown function (DUF5947)